MSRVKARSEVSLRSIGEGERRGDKSTGKRNLKSSLQWESFRRSMLRIGIIVRSSLKMWLDNLEFGVRKGNVAVHDFLFFSAFWHSQAHATRPVTIET